MLENLTGKEIVAIIRVCKESGVKQLTLNSLVIDFRTQEEANPTPSHIHYTAEPPASQSNDQLPDHIVSELDKALLMITDPSAYEAQLLEPRE